MTINRETFRIIFDQHFHALCSFGNRYAKEVSAVEDMAQEVFVSLWEKKENFTDELAIKAFLYTSVRNKCLNYLKHKIVRQKNEDQLIYELESKQFLAEHEIEEEVFSKLNNEIAGLPESCRKIMLLALTGITNKEIALLLNISENTVKTQKKIAYAKLKDKLLGTSLAFLLAF